MKDSIPRAITRRLSKGLRSVLSTCIATAQVGCRQRKLAFSDYCDQGHRPTGRSHLILEVFPAGNEEGHPYLGFKRSFQEAYLLYHVNASWVSHTLLAAPSDSIPGQPSRRSIRHQERNNIQLSLSHFSSQHTLSISKASEKSDTKNYKHTGRHPHNGAQTPLPLHNPPHPPHPSSRPSPKRTRAIHLHRRSRNLGQSQQRTQ